MRTNPICLCIFLACSCLGQAVMPRIPAPTAKQASSLDDSPLMAPGSTPPRNGLGYFGIRMENVNDAVARILKLPDNKGALVSSVMPQSPAAAAGIKEDDVIIQCEGKDLVDSTTLGLLIAQTPPGTKVAMKYIRNGKAVMTTVTVGALSPSMALVYSGNKKAQEGNPAGAVADFTEAIRLDPKCETGYLERGRAKAGGGEFDAAMADYTVAIELDSKNTLAFLNRGLAKANLGIASGAISDFSKAIRLDPKSAMAYQLRGVQKAKSGDCPGALSDYTDAIRLEPRYAVAFLNRGLAKTALGNTSGAAADYTEAIRLYNDEINLNPKDYLSHVNRAMARENSGDKKGAAADRAKAVQIQDETPFAEFRLKAKAWLALPAPPLPEEVIRFRVLAEDATQNKEFQKAADYYERGLALQPLWPDGQFDAALLDGELQLYAKAAAHMRRFLELSPDSKDAKAAREKMYIWEEKAGEATAPPERGSNQ